MFFIFYLAFFALVVLDFLGAGAATSPTQCQPLDLLRYWKEPPFSATNLSLCSLAFEDSLNNTHDFEAMTSPFLLCREDTYLRTAT